MHTGQHGGNYGFGYLPSTFVPGNLYKKYNYD